MSKVFNDPIHGHIELPVECVKIIDTPVFQRLRHIKQLGAAYKVYPGASHNRFEHCLGVCHLAGQFVERLRSVQLELFKTRPELKTDDFQISDKDVLCLKLAGLCHDIGHGPLSHVFETYFIQKHHKKWTHETGTRDLLDYLWKVVGIFRQDSDLDEKDLEFIKELIHTEKMTPDDRKTKTGRSVMKDFLYEIISNYENSIDVDKWDYFARDCYYLGFQNNFDHNRLIKFSRLIEVQEEKGEKRWHICYREKEVENLYHMFYSRVILHRRACLHKTTKIIEIMYMEALEKVNKHFKFIGKENKKIKKISDCILDPVEYCKLTDNIFDAIRYMDQSDKSATQSDKSATQSDESATQSDKSATQSDESATQSDKSAIQSEKIAAEAIQRSIQILNDIENRKIFKFVGEAMIVGEDNMFDKKQLREAEITVADEISQLEIGGSKLDPGEFLINILEFSYGGKGNPVDKVYFYLKSEPEKAVRFKREQVSLLLPTVYREQVVRMYSRKLDSENVERCRNYFEKWCEKSHSYIKRKW